MNINKNEVRVIACDIDGTLLPYGASRISEEIFELIGQLTEKGNSLLDCKWRGEESIRKLFAPVKDRIDYVCANGAIYIENNRIVFTQPFKKEIIHGILNDFSEDANLTPVIMCTDRFYIILSGTEEEKLRKRKFLKESVLEEVIEVTSPDEISQEVLQWC